MNCLNRLLVGVGGRVRVRPCARVALELAGGGAEVPKSALEELELLEWVDFL